MPESARPSAGFAIAIDGPASSGKGTVARLVAQRLGFTYVDTGAMYRAVALFAARAGVPLDDAPALAALTAALEFSMSWRGGKLRVVVDGQDVSTAIRAESVGQGASTVAALPPVRAALLQRQRDMASAEGVVMDGRDIGTVVLPDAQLKVYLDAELGERARRRQAEMAQRGVVMSVEKVAGEIAARDAQDAGRSTAPLREAADALRLDSTSLSPQQVAEHVVAIARARGA